jgi:hypothetical protein
VEFLATASGFYRVPTCAIRVLAARPLRVRERGTFELFGDYDQETSVIRVWMRTAIRKQVTSFGTFVSTLCHEFCHHLDFQKFGFPDSWHTRGFYERAAALYHHARGTPLKKLFWVPIIGGRWRIDWQRTNRSYERTRMSAESSVPKMRPINSGEAFEGAPCHEIKTQLAGMDIPEQHETLGNSVGFAF